MKEINFKCKDNDIKLKFITVDGKIDEIWVRAHKGEGWTVVGYDNLIDGIDKVKKKLRKI